MDGIVLSYIFDRKGVTKKEPKKEALIQIKVYDTKTRKRKYISTGEYILRSQFSPVGAGGLSIIKHPNAAIIKGRIDKLFSKIQSFIYSEECQKWEDIDNWNSENAPITNVVEFIISELKRKEASLSVWQYNKSFIKRLEEYGKIISFNDLSYENIIGLDSHLREYITSEPTLYKRHSLFKGYIQEAINRGIYKGVNPYVFFKSKKGKSKDPVFLVEEEIELIKTYSPNYGYLERTKDLFLFQCFTGMAYADMQNFTKDEIHIVSEHKTIRSNRKKTDENFITLLLPYAEEIAEKYNYDLPKITNQKYNEYLKLVAAGAGVVKKLTSHVARHTFATYLLNKDIPIETVSRAIGHSNIKQTQHYARLLGKKVISDMAKLINK